MTVLPIHFSCFTTSRLNSIQKPQKRKHPKAQIHCLLRSYPYTVLCWIPKIPFSQSENSSLNSASWAAEMKSLSSSCGPLSHTCNTLTPFQTQEYANIQDGSEGPIISCFSRIRWIYKDTHYKSLLNNAEDPLTYTGIPSSQMSRIEAYTCTHLVSSHNYRGTSGTRHFSSTSVVGWRKRSFSPVEEQTCRQSDGWKDTWENASNAMLLMMVVSTNIFGSWYQSNAPVWLFIHLSWTSTL